MPVLSPEESSSLSWPFALEEVVDEVADCDDNKSLGPDEFNFAFIKAFWDLLLPDLGSFFAEFYTNAKLSRSFSSYFVAMIPKVRSH